MIDPVRYVAQFTGRVLVEIGNAIAGTSEVEQVQPLVVHIEAVNITGSVDEALAHLNRIGAARNKLAGMMRRGDA